MCIGYIPANRDIRPITPHREGQCLSQSKEVPRAKPKALPRPHKSTGLTKGKKGSHIALGSGIIHHILGHSDLRVLSTQGSLTQYLLLMLQSD